MKDITVLRIFYIIDFVEVTFTRKNPNLFGFSLVYS
jgi:hypothetical protein